MKYKKTVFITGSIIVLGVVFRGAFAHFYHEEIRQIAIEELDKSTTAPFSFSDIDFSVFRNFPNITGSFENLTITGNDYFLNDTIAFVKRAHFEVSLSKLIFQHEYEIKSFHLEYPKIKLVELEDEDNYSIFRSSTSADTASALNLQLDQITVDHAAVRYIDKVSGVDIQCDELSYSGQGRFDKFIKEVESKIEVRSMNFTSDAEKILNGNKIDSDIKVTYLPKEGKITFAQSSLTIDNFNILWSGDLVMQPTGYFFNMRIESGQTSFKDILTLHPHIVVEDMEHISAAGDFKLMGSLKGLLSDDMKQVPNFDVELKVVDGSFKVDTLALPVKNINIDLALQNSTGNWFDTKIDLKTFHAELGQYPIRGRFKLEGFTDPYIDIDIISKIQLEDLERIFPIPGVDMKGVLGFEFTARGKWSHRFFEKQKKGEEGMVPPFKAFLQMSNGSFKYEHLNQAFDKTHFNLTATNKTGMPEDTDFKFSDFAMHLNNSYITGELSLSNLLEPRINGNLSAELDLSKLKDVMPLRGYELNGNLSVQVKADGTFDRVNNKFPTVNGQLKLKNGYLKSPDHPEAIKNVLLSAEVINETGLLTDSRLRIGQSEFLFEDEPVSLRGTVLNFSDYSYDLFFDGKVDLASMSKIYSVPDVSMQGTVDAHIELKGSLPDIEQKAYQRLKADGKLEIQNFVLQTKDLPAPIKIGEAEIKIEPDKIVLRKLIGKAGSTSIQMQGFINHYMALLATEDEIVKADLAIKFDTLDLGIWLAEPAHISDTTKTRVVPWMIPKNLDFTLDVRGDVLKHPSISISQLDTDAIIRNGILRLNRTNFVLADGKFHLDGDYNPYAGPQPFFDFGITVQDFDIQKAYAECKLIHEMAPAIEHTEGTFSGQYVLQGYLGENLIPITKTIKGEGEIRIASAKINGMKMFERISVMAKRQGLNDPHLKDLLIKTEIRDNHLIVKPFSMKISGFNTDIEGIHDFEGILNYIVRIELLPIEKLKIPFHVSGPYNDPKVALGKGHTLPPD